MLTRTEGIVLKSREYGEADLIVTYLTPARGIITAFAKSPRKTRSRFGSSLEPCTHAKISFWGKEQSAIPRLTQSDIIHSFHQIRDIYHDFVNVSKLTEILVSLTPAGIPNRRLFSFYLTLLNFIESAEEHSREALHLLARIRLISVIGYAPRLGGCGRCGAESLDFYPDAGTTLCRKCAARPADPGSTAIRINHQVSRFYSHTIQWPMHIAYRLKPNEKTLSELSEILERHLQYLLSKKLLSSGFPAIVTS